ncbi:MAG: tetratricopeptide repeat protein [Candidatus Aminicenantales bacterium]
MTRFRRVCFFLIISLALASPWAAAQTEEANNILGQAGASVLALISYGSDKAEILKGSAFALAEDVIVTAYHVVSQAFDVEGLNIKGKKIKLDGILGLDKAHDIALLKPKGKVQALPVGSVESLAAGARLFALGSNESGQVVISEGTFRRIVDLGAAGKILELAMPVPDQFRGGPLVDVNGQLVGMLFIGDRGLKFGLPIASLVSVSRTGKVTEFKSQTQENYFETVDGNNFAGRAAMGLDEQMTARLHLEKAVKINPSDVTGEMLLADIYSRQRDYTEAVSAYKKVTQLDPNRADAFYGLGNILLKQTQYKDAAEALEKAVALGYAGKEVQMDLGGAYEAIPDFAKAAAAYEKYISLGPADAWAAYQRLGICRTNLGEYDAAVAALLEAQKAQPKDLKVRDALAVAYTKAGRLEDAEAVYSAMAEINPPEAKKYYTQVFQMYDGAGKFDKAITPLKKIIELDPKNETNFYYLGMTYFKGQQYDQAVAAFQQSLAIKPDFPHAWYQIGSSYFNAKKYKEAAEAYKKYAALAPEDASGWLNIGVAYNQAKNYEAALEPLKKCVELKPDNAVALANLAIVYINLKDNYSAKEIYNKLVILDPSMAEKLKKYIR